MDLLLKGSGDFVLHKNEITCKEGLEVEEHTSSRLVLRSLGGTSISCINGSVIMSGGVFSGGNVISVNGGNMVMRGGKTYVNGQELVQSKVGNTSFSVPKGYKIVKEDGSDAPASEEEEKKIVSVEVTASCIRSISISGSADIDVTATLSPEVELSVQGSGGINISHDGGYDVIHAKVTGSGDIKGHSCIVKKLYATVTGSGDIKGFHGVAVCHCTLTGSGDIEATYSRGCDKRKNRTGSGDIELEEREIRR